MFYSHFYKNNNVIDLVTCNINFVLIGVGLKSIIHKEIKKNLKSTKHNEIDFCKVKQKNIKN
jgi:hypothetical protein